MLQQTSPEALAVGDSVVSFGRGARRGSGFVIGRDRVLTLAYRLRDDVVETVTRDGERNDGRVLGVDRDLGVAVLDVPTGATLAIRWASDRIQGRGVIGFVTNGYFIDANAMDGFASTWHVGMVFFRGSGGWDQIIEAKCEACGTNLNDEAYRSQSAYGGIRRIGWTG